MKVTIDLTPAQVKGIKNYLKSCDQSATNEDVKNEVRGLVDGQMYAQQHAMADYIRAAEQEENSEIDNVSKTPYYL